MHKMNKDSLCSCLSTNTNSPSLPPFLTLFPNRKPVPGDSNDRFADKDAYGNVPYNTPPKGSEGGLGDSEIDSEGLVSVRMKFLITCLTTTLF